MALVTILVFDLHNWESLCPGSTPFGYKMARISVSDCPEVPGI